MDNSDVFGIFALLLALGGGLYLLLTRPGRTSQGSDSGGARAATSSPASSSPSDRRSSDEEKSDRKKSGEKKPEGKKGKSAAKAASDVSKPPATALPHIKIEEIEEDDEVEPTRIGRIERAIRPPVEQIVFDSDATTDSEVAADERSLELVVYALAQTDPGKRRKQNEDSLLVLHDAGVYVVADGMGGHRGGQLASTLAVGAISEAFGAGRFEADPHEDLPLSASELARAIQMANRAILSKAAKQPELTGMGTTVCAARFTPDKRRLYLGHVGDSRCYRLRDGVMKQMTRDHTMADYGVSGPQGAQLSRAVGVWPTVPIDIVFAAPKLGDVYLLCSDGLTKMVSDDIIAEQLLNEADPKAALETLISSANAEGGRDNITIIHMRVVESKTAT